MRTRITTFKLKGLSDSKRAEVAAASHYALESDLVDFRGLCAMAFEGSGDGEFDVLVYESVDDMGQDQDNSLAVARYLVTVREIES